jgi:hypothetical protein
MTHGCKVLVASVLTFAAGVTPALAQRDRTPPRVVPVPWEPERPAVAKSDAHRLVGRVLAIDRQKRLVKLDTDEGVQLVPAPAMTVAAIREGDLISVPRVTDEPLNALPHQTPRR